MEIINIRIDDELKSQLQDLMSDLGLDIPTYFTMAVKQAVREQTIPFRVSREINAYGNKAYKIAMENTKYDKHGKAVISSDDEWVKEAEWDDIFEQTK